MLQIRKHKEMRYKNLRFLTIIGIGILAACSEPEPDIPIKKFAEIIYETHRTDAIIQVAGFNDNRLNNDSLSYYNHIFKKYGISREDFIKTIQWYVDNPEKFQELYTEEMKIVAQKEEQYEELKKQMQDSLNAKDTNDIWNLKKDWRLPLDGNTETISFEIPDSLHGTYTLTADMIYYSDDKTVNPRITIMAKYTDDTYDQQSTFGVEKDGQRHSYVVKIKTNEQKQLKMLSGWVLDHSTGTENKHVDVYNIELKYSKE